MRTRILVAYDGSEPAQKACEFVLKTLCHQGPDLAIVAVVRPSELAVDVGAQDVIENACGQLTVQMAQLERRARFAGANTTSMIRWGHPAQQIVQVAREWKADLIVTGQRTGFSLTRWLGFSVSHQIRARSPCAVRVVAESFK